MSQTTDKRWVLERYDAAVGGWKPVYKAWDDDTPATYRSLSGASKACRRMRQTSAYDYRVREVTP